MNSCASIQRLIGHAHWADQLVLQALEALRDPPPDAINLLAHILTAEAIYLERMKGLDPFPQDFWPGLSLPECSAALTVSNSSYAAFLREVTETDLSNLVSYRNSRGQRFETGLSDLLSHVALHGTYHRGQIGSLLRAAGVEPVNTDFITYVRQL